MATNPNLNPKIPKYEKNNIDRKSFDTKSNSYEQSKKPFFPDGFLTVNALTKEAEERGKQFAENKLSIAQMRQFYGEIKYLERLLEVENFNDILPLIKMLKSKASYKTYNNKIPPIFKAFIHDAIERINDKKSFSDFCKLFEAIVGFYYSNNPK
ncbi:MAG TPA: type III-A CRISPR-associated protein Csm2 [Bacteroidota bacterium]|nr:type III-A CRISPR-associated protein Csm2 [Bacteroidota bacterium]